MKVFTFTPRTAGTNIFVSHINGVQDAINYLSDELTNGIGYRDQPRVFKLATPNTGYASLNLPGATSNTDPTTLAAGDFWNNNGALKFYTGSATKTLAFLDSNITGTANVVVSKGGTTVGTRKQVNLIEGSNVTLTVTDDSANDRVNVTVTSTASGTADVASNTATSVDGEVALFSGTAGKTIKRATITGIAKLTSGVLSAATAGTDYAAATHTHAATDTTSGTFDIARIPTGITSTTVSLGNHTHTGVYEPAFTTLSSKTIDNSNTATFKAGSFTLQDSTTTTKQMVFSLASITAATTRTITVPDVTGTMTVLGNTTTGTGSTLVLSAGPTFTGTVSADTINATTLQQGGTAVSLSGHTHVASAITSGTLDIARIPTGTTSTTVALGNHNHALSGLSDVVLTSISNGQVLVWDTATSKWVNSTVSTSGGTGDVTGVASSVDGEVTLFSGTTGKAIKRATGTGYVKVSSGVYQTPSATIPWVDVTKTGSNLTDIETRSHTSLSDIGTNTHAAIDTALTRLVNTSGTNTGDQVVPANTTATSNQYFSAYNSSTGAFTKAQPTFSGLSGVSAAAPASGEYLRYNGTNWVDAQITGSWTVVIGDGVNAIATGYQLPVVYVPFDHVLTSHTILVPSGTTAELGTISIQVRRQPLANYPGTTNLTTIATPALSSGTNQTLVTTSSLSTAVSAGLYRFNVASNTGTTKVAIIWEFYRTT